MTTETKQNDYSLLREFNLEQAQAGGEILYLFPISYTYAERLQEVKFKGLTSNLQEMFVEDEQGEGYCRSVHRIKMKPLCWLEGKPVYKGDVLYYTYAGALCEPFIVSTWFLPLNEKEKALFSTKGVWAYTKELTLNKPESVHQEVMNAYNSGVLVEMLCKDKIWRMPVNPSWCDTNKYRIKPKKKSGWINIWKCSSATGVSTGSQIYLSKGDALAGLLGQWDLVDTVEITWME